MGLLREGIVTLGSRDLVRGGIWGVKLNSSHVTIVGRVVGSGPEICLLEVCQYRYLYWIEQL